MTEDSARPEDAIAPASDMTIKDIARMAGVSVATVSRAINNPGIVTPAKLKAVEAVLARVNYIPNNAARALVKRTDIYFFDDSFSALDVATDATLRAALTTHVPAATRLVVAQRVSTVRDADQIVVIDHGQIVGLGTHIELLETSETYREIVESQESVEASA